MLRSFLYGVCIWSFVCVGIGFAEDKSELYKKFQPADSGHVRENIEWSTTYSFNATDQSKPRLLLIGDSICNGYNQAVADNIRDKMNITFWASSKCVTDRDYFKELDLILGANHYDVISFNNGLHSLGTDPATWEIACRAVVRFIKAKCPGAKLFLCNCTPLKDPALTAKSQRINGIIEKIAQEEKLPVIDLFSAMNPLDRNEFWSDTYHFKQPAIKIQAKTIVERITEK